MNFTYRTVWVLSNLFFGTYCRRRFCNPERVPATGPAILAANHASFFDPPLVGAGLQRTICYLARDTLYTNPLLTTVLHQLNTIPVDREGGGAKGLKAIMDRLTGGAAIILFPEGTRTHDGQFRPARAGIGLLVAKSQCPVIPIRIFGSYEAFSRHHRVPRPHQMIVKYGRPLWFRELRAETQTCSKPRLKAIYQQIADELMFQIGKLQPGTDKETFP